MNSTNNLPLNFRLSSPLPIEVEILKKMTPLQKFKAFHQLCYTARQLKAAGLKMSHPNWSKEQIAQAVKKNFLYART